MARRTTLGLLIDTSLATMLVACHTSETRPQAQAVVDPVVQPQRGELQRVELFRLAQDMHPDRAYAIVADAWLAAAGDEIVAVELGWVDASENDARSGFGRGVLRHVDIAYERQDADNWTIRLGTAAVRYLIDVELDAEGHVAAFGDSSGRRCHLIAGRIVTRRVLGIPAGIARIEVTCRTGAGLERDGELQREPS